MATHRPFCLINPHDRRFGDDTTWLVGKR